MASKAALCGMAAMLLGPGLHGPGAAASGDALPVLATVTLEGDVAAAWRFAVPQGGQWSYHALLIPNGCTTCVMTAWSAGAAGDVPVLVNWLGMGRFQDGHVVVESAALGGTVVERHEEPPPATSIARGEMWDDPATVGPRHEGLFLFTVSGNGGYQATITLSASPGTVILGARQGPAFFLRDLEDADGDLQVVAYNPAGPPPDSYLVAGAKASSGLGMSLRAQDRLHGLFLARTGTGQAVWGYDDPEGVRHPFPPCPGLDCFTATEVAGPPGDYRVWIDRQVEAWSLAACRPPLGCAYMADLQFFGTDLALP